MGAEEDDPVDRAAEERRERLRALRAAKELLDTPDNDEERPSAGPTVKEESSKGDVLDADGGTREVMPDEDLTDQAAAARRERLKALREAKRLLETPDGDTVQTESKAEGSDGDDAGDEKKLNVKFRNYVPYDKQLQEHKLAPPVLPKFEDPVAANPIPEKIEDPFLNIAPKKPNWDLRRDVQKKLDKLEKRTQKAIYQLYLKQEEEKQSLELNGGTVEDG